MKVAGNVVAIRAGDSPTGDVLELVVSGRARGSSKDAAGARVEITIPDSPRARRAFYVGRRVVVALEPVS